MRWLEKNMTAVPTFSAQGGELRATLFENQRVRVPRGVYWSCSVDFAALVDADEQPGPDADPLCTLVCDWLSWPVRCWREIRGLTLASSVGPLEVETSLYFAREHQSLSVIELCLQPAQADRFRVTGRFAGDLLDAAGDRFRGLGAEFDIEIPFTGISVLPDSVTPTLKSTAEAVIALEQFADLDSYETAVWEDVCWLFRPKVGVVP